MIHKRRVLVGAFLLAVIGLGGFVSVASASHAWDHFHWARTSNPFTLKLGDNVSSAWDSYLRAASADWKESNVLNTKVVDGRTDKSCRPTAGRVEVCNGTYGTNGWVGTANIRTSGSHIIKGIVKVNDSYFNAAPYNKSSWRQKVLCEELGHILGLDHRDENFTNLNLGTCMDYTNDPARNDGLGNNVHPDTHDFKMLQKIYAHLDNTATVEQSADSLASREALDAEFSDDQTTWGKEIKRSTDGHLSLFEKDLGNGEKVFRHVFWAEPRKNGDK